MKDIKNLKGIPNTKKGKVPVRRVLTKDHTLYPLYFDEKGKRRKPEETNKLVKEMAERVKPHIKALEKKFGKTKEDEYSE